MPGFETIVAELRWLREHLDEFKDHGHKTTLYILLSFHDEEHIPRSSTASSLILHWGGVARYN